MRSRNLDALDELNQQLTKLADQQDDDIGQVLQLLEQISDRQATIHQVLTDHQPVDPHRIAKYVDQVNEAFDNLTDQGLVDDLRAKLKLADESLDRLTAGFREIYHQEIDGD